MPRTNIESELRSRVDAFVADLSEIIHQAALDSVREVLEDAAPARRGPGRPRKTAGAPRKATTRKAAKKASKRGGRVRRSSEDLEQLSGAFLAYVKSNPGQRLEEIGAGMGIATKELKRPVQLLLEAGSIRTEGQRRGTKYFARSGKAKAAPSRKRKTAKKAGKRKAKRKSSKRGKAAKAAA